MSPFESLVDLVTILRGPDGCPWDKAQDPSTLRPYLIEEAYEVVETIDEQNQDAMRIELGDLLFMVVLLAQMAAERGEWTIDDVCTGIHQKMVMRHPHVFDPDNEEVDPGSIAAWEARKARERPLGESTLSGIPSSLPALLRAHRVGEKVSRVGFDWPSLEGVKAKVDEEMGELEEAIAGGNPAEITHEYGDLLLAVANMGRFLDVGPEEALREALARFGQRFSKVETLARSRSLALHDLDLEKLESLWSEAKK